jgi:transposase
MALGVILDDEGNPICSEMWPGNTADVKSLLPVAKRLKERFNIENICIVADRGMISDETMRDLDALGWKYILGVRMRRSREVKEEVLTRGGRYREVTPPGKNAKDPAPLKVKEVRIEEKRYIICLNEYQAEKDRRDRDAIVAALRDALSRGDKSLIGNKGYRRFVKSAGERFIVDEEKIGSESLYDGKWVLTTSTELSAENAALKYKQLWMVEDIFRSMKSLLRTRPIYHKRDETIRGHVFCSFLALLLRKELQYRLDAKRADADEPPLEWADIIRNLDNLGETELTVSGKRYIVRAESTGTTAKVFAACSIALPPMLRQR